MPKRKEVQPEAGAVRRRSRRVYIDNVDSRDNAEARREPYWYRVAKGRYLGFRKMTKNSPGTWLARIWDGERKIQRALDSDFSELPEKERFDAAKAEAEDFFRLHGAGVSHEKRTVADACRAYVAAIRSGTASRKRRRDANASADDAEARFERRVYKDVLGRRDIQKLAPRHFADWKERHFTIENAASFNRNATALRAALNLALKRREVLSAVAWKDELAPIRDADGARTLYLTKDARRRLIEAASDEVKPYLRTLALLPLRPGDVAALKVEYLDTRHRLIRIPLGKTRTRDIPLAPEALAHFKACAKSKLPSAWLVSRADGRQWDKYAWRDMIRDAIRTARLPKATCATVLRHSTITDLVVGGLDLFTVAQIAGTSVGMIEKNYGKLLSEHSRKALANLELGAA